MIMRTSHRSALGHAPEALKVYQKALSAAIASAATLTEQLELQVSFNATDANWFVLLTAVKLLLCLPY